MSNVRTDGALKCLHSALLVHYQRHLSFFFLPGLGLIKHKLFTVDPFIVRGVSYLPHCVIVSAVKVRLAVWHCVNV